MDDNKTPKTNEEDKAQLAQSVEKADTQQHTAEQPQEKATESESDEPFDFGGLPARNLKKNLGCG